MIKIGDKAPDFLGLNQNGEEIGLSNFKGKKLVIYFYPKDMTPGCTVQACNLRDNYEELKKNGFEILGVSADSEKRHSTFISNFDLPFDLIADTEKSIINAFGVWGPKKFMGRTFDGIHRKTFVIDESGLVSNIIDKVKTKNHSAQILENV